VLYIFRNQLEEADAIVLNKIDTLDADRRRALIAVLKEHFPGARVFETSARTGEGVDAWMDYVLRGAAAGQHVATVDYDIYAEGEAALGWLNALVELSASGSADWEKVCKKLLECVRRECAARGAEIAHVKLLLQTAQGAITGNVTDSTRPAAIQNRLSGTPASGMLTFNARVHMAPEDLEALVRECLSRLPDGVADEIRDVRSFQPGRPRPVHRYDAPVGGA